MIDIKIAFGRVYDVKIASDDTVGALKKIIESQTGVPCNLQKIVHKSKYACASCCDLHLQAVSYATTTFRFERRTLRTTRVCS
jgi:hypothetical protein